MLDDSFMHGFTQHQRHSLPIASVIGKKPSITTFTSTPHVFRPEQTDPKGSCFFYTSATGMRYAGMLPNVTTYEHLSGVAKMLRKRLADYLRTHKQELEAFFSFDDTESNDFKHYQNYDTMCDKLEREKKQSMSEFVPDAAVAVFGLVTGIAISIFISHANPVYMNAVDMQTYLPQETAKINASLPVHKYTSFIPGSISIANPHICMNLANVHYVPLIDIFRIRMYIIGFFFFCMLVTTY